MTHRGDVERDLVLAANRVRFKTPEAEEDHNLLHIVSFFLSLNLSLWIGTI